MKSFIAIIIFGAVGLGIGLFVPDTKTKDTTDTASTHEAQNQAQPQQVEAQATPLNYAEGDTLWIDVRTDGEFQSGHLDKAVNVPLNVIQDQWFRKSKPKEERRDEKSLSAHKDAFHTEQEKKNNKTPTPPSCQQGRLYSKSYSENRVVDSRGRRFPLWIEKGTLCLHG